jgi:hypothetical protein
MVKRARAKNMEVIILTVIPHGSHPLWSREIQGRIDELNSWILAQAREGVRPVDMSLLGVNLPNEENRPRLRKQISARDGYHPTATGRDFMAQLIADQAFGTRTAPRQAGAMSLQQFAEANWKNLATDLATAVRFGNPAGVIALTSNLPKGQDSLDVALRILKRDDIERAFDRIFSEYLKGNPEFTGFCSTREEYKGIIGRSVRLSADLPREDRELVWKAVQEFINFTAGRATDKPEDAWYKRLRDDLLYLYRGVLKGGEDKLPAEGKGDVRTLAALAVYVWRSNHRTEQSRAWAKEIPAVKKMPEAERPAVEEKEKPSPGRRMRMDRLEYQKQ